MERTITVFKPTPRSSCSCSGIAPPQFDAGGLEPAVVLLVHGLPGDAERLGDLAPAPAGAHGALDGGVFEPVGEFAQSHDGGEVVGFGSRGFRHVRGHVSNLGCLLRFVNRSCLASGRHEPENPNWPLCSSVARDCIEACASRHPPSSSSPPTTH